MSESRTMKLNLRDAKESAKIMALTTHGTELNEI